MQGGARRATAAAIVLALLAALMPAAAPAQPRPVDKITLRLDWVNLGFHALWYYARDKGFFAEQGLDIEILEGRGSDLTAQTVGNGSVMFGTADAAAVMSLIAQGLPVKIVGSYFKSSPIAFVFPRKKGWKTFKDMEGASVGYGALLATSVAAIKAAGLEGKLRMVKMDPGAVPLALLESRVDAVMTFGFQYVPLFESKGLPVSTFPIADAGVHVPGLALITSTDLSKRNPDLVKRFVAAAQKAMEVTQKEPRAAIDSLLKRAPALDPAISLRVLELSFPLYTSESGKGKPLTWIPSQDIERAQDALLAFGAVKARHPIEAYFTNEFVPGGGS
jgi:NitT/TauT family transport system substrate-binding protein